jgi:hypothetical protein
MDLVDRMGWSALASGLFLMVAAVGSELSGTQADVSNHVINTHAPATLVLACLGIVLVANGFVLLAHTSRSAQDPEAPGDS